MSYDLWILDAARHPLANETFEEVERVFVDLQEVQDGLNPKFVEFARKLVARYPSSDMLDPSDVDADESVWSMSPVALAHMAQGALFGLSVPQSDPFPVVRAVVEAANATGLAVLDMELAMAFLPSGRVLPENKQEPWFDYLNKIDAQPVGMTKAQVKKQVIAELEDVLVPYGFKSSPPAKLSDEFVLKFVRQIESGYQLIIVYIRKNGSEFKCGIHFSIFSEPVEEICRKVYTTNCRGGGGEEAISFFLRSFVTKDVNWGHPVSTLKEIKELRNLVEAKAVPFLQCTRTLKGMNEFIFNDGQSLGFIKYHFGNLIVSRLTGNQNFELQVQQMQSFYTHQETSEELQRLVAYLREHVTPVV